jgi:hypothetical protein
MKFLGAYIRQKHNGFFYYITALKHTHDINTLGWLYVLHPAFQFFCMELRHACILCLSQCLYNLYVLVPILPCAPEGIEILNIKVEMFMPSFVSKH